MTPLLWGCKLVVWIFLDAKYLTDFIEICGHDTTDPASLAFSKEVFDSMGRKTVIMKKPMPGFIGNRLQHALWREALYLVEQGVCDARDVDTCLNYSWCPRYTSIGIFEHMDNSGLGLNKMTCNTIFPSLSNMDRPPASITDRVDRGETGPKADSKIGFYDWNGVDMQKYKERVAAPYWHFADWDLPEE